MLQVGGWERTWAHWKRRCGDTTNTRKGKSLGDIDAVGTSAAYQRTEAQRMTVQQPRQLRTTRLVRHSHVAAFLHITQAVRHIQHIRETIVRCWCWSHRLRRHPHIWRRRYPYIRRWPRSHPGIKRRLGRLRHGSATHCDHRHRNNEWWGGCHVARFDFHCRLRWEL